MNWNLPWTAHLGLRGPDTPLFRHSAKSANPFDQLDFIADLGFAGVQDNFAALRPATEQVQVAEYAAKLGLKMASFVHDPAGWNLPGWSAPDDERRAALLAKLDQSLDTARRIGGRIVTCVAGFDPARDRAEQLAAMADNLRWAGDKAAASGAVLCVEMTSPRWLQGMLVERFGDATAMVREVGHPAVRLMFDIGHIALNGDDPLAAFEQAADIVGAVQVADVPAGGEPGRIDVGGGTTPWTALLKAIRASGYADLLEIEHQAQGEGAAGEARLIERLCAVDEAVSKIDKTCLASAPHTGH